MGVGGGAAGAGGRGGGGGRKGGMGYISHAARGESSRKRVPSSQIIAIRSRGMNFPRDRCSSTYLRNPSGLCKPHPLACASALPAQMPHGHAGLARSFVSAFARCAHLPPPPCLTVSIRAANSRSSSALCACLHDARSVQRAAHFAQPAPYKMERAQQHHTGTAPRSGKGHAQRTCTRA